MTEAHRWRCQEHVRRRAWRRFGLALANPDITAIEDSIRDGGGEDVGTQPDGRYGRRMTVRGRILVVVFDPRLDCAVTLLPTGWPMPVVPR